MFADGTEVYKKFADKYITHSKGFFVLAPSGTGKTHYIKSQSEKHWIDGDELWMATNAHPNNAWWTTGDASSSLREVDFRSDLITLQAKKLGFWVMGASNLWLRPDAIVIPDWEQHKQFIAKREQNNYDGGATTDRLQQVINHRERIQRHAKSDVPEFWRLNQDDSTVPQFDSIEKAANYIASLV
jgi:hypothetical protein